jgi:hypothetical protein
LTPTGRIKKPSVTSLAVDPNSVSHQKWLWGFQKCCISSKWVGLMTICCGITVMRMEMLAVSVRKMNAPTVKMEGVILIGKGR